MKDSSQVWTGILPQLWINPNQDSLYPLGSLWRKGMLRRKTIKIRVKMEMILIWNLMKNALITESERFGIKETWGRYLIISMEQATWIEFRFGIILYFNHCNFLSFFTALLENDTWCVETSCSKYNIYSSQKVFELIEGFVHHFFLHNVNNPNWAS